MVQLRHSLIIQILNSCRQMITFLLRQNPKFPILTHRPTSFPASRAKSFYSFEVMIKDRCDAKVWLNRYAMVVRQAAPGLQKSGICG